MNIFRVGTADSISGQITGILLHLLLSVLKGEFTVNCKLYNKPHFIKYLDLREAETETGKK
jgi:hypothetical protein